jgi:hypothetical protein
MRWADRRKMRTQFLSGKLRGRDNLEYLGINERIMLKWVLKK